MVLGKCDLIDYIQIETDPRIPLEEDERALQETCEMILSLSGKAACTATL